MTTRNRAVGDAGEKHAENFLVEKGFMILARNFIARGGEIDIIAEKEEEIVFVEVKTRGNEKFGHPLESISQRKIARLKIAAWEFLEKNKLQDRNFRFDLITILRGEIEHYENAFEE